MEFYDRRLAGEKAENEACIFLQRKGLRLLETNFYCACGEIDLIMQDKNCIVFVEVRSNKTNAYGWAKETVTSLKMKKLFKTATFYLQRKGMLNSIDSRFDIVGINTYLKGPSRVEWIINAFTDD